MYGSYGLVNHTKLHKNSKCPFKPCFNITGGSRYIRRKQLIFNIIATIHHLNMKNDRFVPFLHCMPDTRFYGHLINFLIDYERQKAEKKEIYNKIRMKMAWNGKER